MPELAVPHPHPRRPPPQRDRAGRPRAVRPPSPSASPVASLPGARSQPTRLGVAAAVQPCRADRHRCLARHRSGSRLVARTCILGQGGSSAATSAAHAPSRCSQVSRMSSRCRSRSWSTSTSRRLRVYWSGSRSAAAMVCGSSASSRSRSSRSSRLPSAKPAAAARAAARLTAVLPTPGSPVTVTSGAPSSMRRIAAASAARPTRPAGSSGSLGPGGSPGIGRRLQYVPEPRVRGECTVSQDNGPAPAVRVTSVLMPIRNT